MSREVHVRFWESAEVRSLRATRQKHKPVTATINVSFELEGGLDENGDKLNRVLFVVRG